MCNLTNISPCLKCGRFGHSVAKCRNDSTCVKGTQNHSVSEFKSRKIKCVNCLNNNNKFRTSLPTDHLPTDRINCNIPKNKIKKYISSIDYPIEPTLPTYDESSAMKIMQNHLTHNLFNQNNRKTVKSMVDRLTSTPPKLQLETKFFNKADLINIASK